MARQRGEPGQHSHDSSGELQKGPSSSIAMGIVGHNQGVVQGALRAATQHRGAQKELGQQCCSAATKEQLISSKELGKSLDKNPREREEEDEAEVMGGASDQDRDRYHPPRGRCNGLGSGSLQARLLPFFLNSSSDPLISCTFFLFLPFSSFSLGDCPELPSFFLFFSVLNHPRLLSRTCETSLAFPQLFPQHSRITLRPQPTQHARSLSALNTLRSLSELSPSLSPELSHSTLTRLPHFNISCSVRAVRNSLKARSRHHSWTTQSLTRFLSTMAQARRSDCLLDFFGVHMVLMGPRDRSMLATDFRRQSPRSSTGPTAVLRTIRSFWDPLARSDLTPTLTSPRQIDFGIGLSNLTRSRSISVEFESQNRSSRFTSPRDERDHTSHGTSPHDEPAITIRLAEKQGWWTDLLT
ncbi:hypothetical protein CRG98_010424 [Punica granatum]|uniref:Uncharacterized protein n=1 Tax=Punica granatum TaxID=22663 RepID=A0A2I0KKW7_PUNGR|nr:hypothetical protein CRG98_010424 [Punica granatum]